MPVELVNTRKKVEDLFKELSATHGNIKIVDSKFDDFKNDMLRSESRLEYSKTTEVPQTFIDNLFVMPYPVVCILYTLFVAYKTNTQFDKNLIEAIGKENFSSKEYFLGLVSALISFKIIETETEYLSNLKIDSMSPYLCSNIKNKVLSYFTPEEVEERKKYNSESSEEFVERINKLFGYTE